MKHAFVSYKELQEITKEHATPFHLYDESQIRKNTGLLKAAFDWNSSFKEYFAVKANPNPVILSLLREEGCGVDCASLTELMLAQRSGFRDTEILLSSNATPPEDFRLARKLGAYINLDDISHINTLAENGGIPETLFLRYNPGSSFTIGNSIMSRPGDAKYGFTREQLSQGLRGLVQRGLKGFGLHAFLSSNTMEEDYYPALARLLFSIAVELVEETGCPLMGIDLSGGIGIVHKPEEKAMDIRVIGDRIQQAYETILVPAGLGNTALFTELGRWLLGPAGCLVTKVLYEKRIQKNYLSVDACSADLMRPAMYGAYHHITVAGKEGEEPTGLWDVAGGLCENRDKFAIDRPLPQAQPGDLLIIHDTGAHGRAMGYNYNGKLRSAELLLREDGTVRLIRRAETPADYFATLDILEGYP